MLQSGGGRRKNVERYNAIPLTPEPVPDPKRDVPSVAN